MDKNMILSRGDNVAKVKKTLHEVYEEMKWLREQRDIVGRVLSSALVNDNQGIIEQLKKDYKHWDDVITYMSHIEVEYEDKYEPEDE